MSGKNRVPNNTDNGGEKSEDDRSPIFYCPLCPGPVYTPYMEHYFKFHPDFPEVRISLLPDNKLSGAVSKQLPHSTNQKLNSLDNGGKRAIMAKFQKAKSEQAYFKVALYGKTGSGKTLTSLLWAEGLAAREGKRVAFVDTERGSEFYAMDIPERTVHPKAFDFDRLITRSLMETLEVVEALDTKTYGVLGIEASELGAPMHYIQSALGHGSVAVTERYYAKYDPRSAARQLLKVIEGGRQKKQETGTKTGTHGE
jgi:hypothetical protein